MENKILIEDLKSIYDSLSSLEKEKLKDSKILLTGCGGFLGYYFVNFFTYYSKEFNIKSIIGLDNFKLGKPIWLEKLIANNKIKVLTFDITKDKIEDIKEAYDIDYVIHMASIASPMYYRKYPIETLDANVWGLRSLLDFYKGKSIKGFLFFSSSEIYGDPLKDYIPTKENYNGNVSMIGPRACYDEAKRFGETLCYLFNNQYKMPITVARPFNNYGPGMKLNDKRVPADFAKAIYENNDIIMYSDGSPTRTFCYIADAILGYIKTLLYGEFECFNIGIDKPEISIKELANIYKEKGKEILNYSGDIKFMISEDEEYLSNNPSRRCPNIDKARKKLNYTPKTHVEEGVKRFLEYIKFSEGEELQW